VDIFNGIHFFLDSGLDFISPIIAFDCEWTGLKNY